MAHAGSWLGLPDFGITEAIGGVLGRPTTTQGGSNIFGGSSQPSQASSPVVTQQPGLSSQAIPGSGYTTQYANNPTNQSAPTSGGGNSGGGNNDSGGQTVNQGNLTSMFPGYAGWDSAAAWADYLATGGSGKGGGGNSGPNYDQIRGEISSGWDQYIGSLNDMIGGLGTQRSAQENIVQSQYGQGVNQLDLQKKQGVQTLDQQRGQAEQNQVKNLRDIASNIKNSFMAGNNYLGSMGAGDSSAADQYSFALTKMGTKQRSDVMQNTATIMNDIGGRETNLNNIYNSEVNNLAFERDQGINGVAQWFADAQNKLKQMQAEGQLNKSQDLSNLSKDILNRAMAQMDTVNNYVMQKKAALEQWAINQSKSIADVKKNLASISDVSYNLPTAQQTVGTPSVDSSGNLITPRFFGSSNERDKLFG